MRKLLLLLTLLPLFLHGADITGTWTAAVTLDVGSGTATFTFQQAGEKLTGTYAGTLGEAKLTGTVKGEQVEFGFTSDQAGTIVYKATLDGATKMKGTAQYGQLGAGTFTAEKK